VKKLSEILALIYPKKIKRRFQKEERINPFGSATFSSGNIMVGNLDKNGHLKLSLI
jgi:hypothetical protein